MEVENQEEIEVTEELNEEEIEETPVEQEEEEEVAEAPKEDEMQRVRFKVVRDEKERLERERNELMTRLEKYERSNNYAPQKQEEEHPEYSLNPDDLVEAKHLSKYDREIQAIRKEFNAYKQQSTAATVESRLKAQYPDFDRVVSKENINVLREAYPEIAATISSNPDLYSQAVSAYTLINKLGIIPNDVKLKSTHRIMKNAEKPLPSTSLSSERTSDSPLSKAHAFAGELTDEEKSALYEEMLRDSKG